ncbi:MAG: hypothetical protein ACI3YX_02220, partial [Prevotella sp.]
KKTSCFPEYYPPIIKFFHIFIRLWQLYIYAKLVCESGWFSPSAMLLTAKNAIFRGAKNGFQRAKGGIYGAKGHL